MDIPCVQFIVRIDYCFLEILDIRRGRCMAGRTVGDVACSVDVIVARGGFR